MTWGSQAAVGAVFEELIIMANDRYRRTGHGVIHKIPTEWIPLRDRTGKIRSAKVSKKAAVDFIGVFEGIPIAFDAKHTNSDRRMAWSRLEPHQQDFLTAFKHAGGMAFVLIEWKLSKHILVPIGFWGLEGKSILLPEAHERWGVKMPDYLAAIEK